MSDKTGIVPFAEYLHKNLGVEILSTGGTEKALQEAGLPVISVSDYTGFPEMMNGRLKTLHPKIHGGILARRDNAEHMQALSEHGMKEIDLLVVNLYPFEATVAKEDCDLATAIENIDIGGPTMLRAAAKNHQDVAVIVDPDDYDKVKLELENHGGALSYETRLELAKTTFSHTAHYDGAISNYLTSLNEKQEREKFPKVLNLQYKKVLDLRYGENPHQDAVYYSEGWQDEPCVGNARYIQGKQLSFNNILDLNAALEIVKSFEKATCVVLKHNNPCGVASHDTDLQEAFKRAMACDPVSAFGGILAFNREVDESLAKNIIETFFECIIAPDYTYEAKQIFTQKQNLRVMKTLPIRRYDMKGFDSKKVVGGLLVQDRDLALKNAAECKVVSNRKPTVEELASLDFAWRVCKHVKSNAIVYAKDMKTLGIGAGQMSRVDSIKIGVDKAQESLKGAVIASDAFFPFRDSIDFAAEKGISAVIQPGGSIRDQEVIDAVNEHNMAMVFTEQRHFKH